MDFIFDIGNVLVDYKPLAFLEKMFPGKPFTKNLYETVFLSKEWLYLDQDTITWDDAFDTFCERLPELKAEIRLVRQKVNDIFTPLDETIKLLPEIKRAGHGLYFLSNISADTRDYLMSEFDFLDMFDGGVYSCDVKMLKPFRGIYDRLLEKYDLCPEDCIFFDDVPVNADSANAAGIKGVVFTGADCILPFL